MSRFYPDDMSSAELDDAPDFLHDKPEGFCPWCNKRLMGRLEGGEYIVSCQDWLCRYDSEETEVKNRQQYAKEREQNAKTEERVTRELARRQA